MRGLFMMMVVLSASCGDGEMKPSVRLSGHKDPVDAVAFTPDGKLLVSAAVEVKVWDPATGAEQASLHPRIFAIRSIAIDPEGNIVLMAGGAGHIKRWDIHTREERTILRDPGGAVLIALSPDGNTLAVSGRDGVMLWDLAAGERQGVLEGEKDGFLAFSPDGKILAVASRRELNLWDVSEREKVRQLEGHGEGFEIQSLEFSPDGKTLATAAIKGYYGPNADVKLWDVRTGKEQGRLSGHRYGVFSVAFSPDGRLVATGGEDRLVKVWDFGTGEELRSFPGHRYQVSALAFSPDGRLLASGGAGGRVLIWDVSELKDATD